MARYRIFYWKHIPASIIVEGDGRTIKKQLLKESKMQLTLMQWPRG